MKILNHDMEVLLFLEIASQQNLGEEESSSVLVVIPTVGHRGVNAGSSAFVYISPQYPHDPVVEVVDEIRYVSCSSSYAITHAYSGIIFPVHSFIPQCRSIFANQSRR
mmetsp:Transcript_43379/g.104847  ORF Transcript_43379/g.104847 Transcript_43379/m.104847 type:complete len:108 (-) Transcript_43379:7-330(-)